MYFYSEILALDPRGRSVGVADSSTREDPMLRLRFADGSWRSTPRAFDCSSRYTRVIFNTKALQILNS